MSSAKVVGIHGVKAPASSAAKSLPEVVIKLREHSKDRVRAALVELFNNADDALFAMADKAESNVEQTTYFEAMRELRLQRKSIVISTIGGVVRSFNTVGESSSTSESESSIATSIDDLSLVDDEKLEFDVAIEGMVQRVRGAATDVLSNLSHRIRSVYEQDQIADESLPVSPELLCKGFVEGCAKLESDMRAKLVVLKLFERYVLAVMPQVYEELNQLLVNANVLPDLKANKTGNGSNRTSVINKGDVPGSSSSTGVESSSDASGVHGAPSNVSVDLDGLRQLLHPQGVRIPQAGATQTTVGIGSQVIAQQDILHTLSLFQSGANDALQTYSSASQAIDFNALLASRLGGVEQGKSCGELDADMINLVSMLFEFILEDRQLQPQMKALISRLQIPILKVALLDKSFFSKGGHSARKLLNEMASSAIGWNAPKAGRRDRFKEKLESIIETITNDFIDDVSIFDELLVDFENFSEAERRRGLLVEQRTKDSERGRAAADEARRAAQNLINEVIESRAVPDLGVELLRDAWSNVLVLRYLREGVDSEVWAESRQFVSELAWSLCPDPNEPEARAKLLKMIPSLVKRCRQGFEEIAFDDVQGRSLLKRLEDQHVLSLQALQQQVDLEETAVLAEEKAKKGESNVDAIAGVETQNDEVSELVRSTLDLEEDFKLLQEACELADEKQQKLETNAELPKKQESIVLVAEQEQVEQEVLADDSPFLQQVDRFVVGCWFEFAKEDSKPERCKLAAIIKASDKFIFVNRAGIKVAEKNRMELAKDLRAGSLQALNDGLLFDRALESIITNLRS